MQHQVALFCFFNHSSFRYLYIRSYSKSTYAQRLARVLTTAYEEKGTSSGKCPSNDALCVSSACPDYENRKSQPYVCAIFVFLFYCLSRV